MLVEDVMGLDHELAACLSYAIKLSSIEAEPFNSILRTLTRQTPQENYKLTGE